jgi:DNA-binding beta-propeller fold protein YncE
VSSFVRICLFALLLPIEAQAAEVLTPIGGWPLTYTHSGLAVAASGIVYAADGYVGQVDYFTPQGILMGSFTAAGGPVDIAVDRSGFVHVVYNTGRVEKFTPQGVHVSEFTDSREGLASSIALDDAGNVYVGRYAVSAAVAKFDPAGKFIREFPSSGVQAIEVDAGGNVYAAGGNYVAKFSPSGNLLSELTSTGACQDLHLTDLALDADGHVLLANFTLSTVLFLSPDLACLGSWTMPAPPNEIVQQTLPVHLAFGAGNVFVQDVMFNRVARYRYDVTTPAIPVTWGQVKVRYR